MPCLSSREPLLPDLLAPGLGVIFIGAAPSVAAASAGHYYAGRRNRFWRLLHQAGFTPRELRPDEDRLVMEFGIGLTAILPGEISTSNNLLRMPTESERERVAALVQHYRPGFVCFNGRDVYRLCRSTDPPRWGLLEETWHGARQFVVHSSSGRADRWGADRLFLYRELHAIVEENRERHARLRVLE